jgi:hypothetical protein
MASDKSTNAEHSDDRESDDKPETDSGSQTSKDVLEKASREATKEDHTVA